MKYLKFLTLILTLTFTACQGQNKSKTISTDQSISKVEVIDFYGTHRCVTCEAIEANAKYTVDNYFSEEKKKGTVVFKTVNVDKDENYDMAERFEASGTALFLNVIKDGMETHIDLTNFAFSKGKEKEVFSKELKAKIDNELNKL
jgi:kynurenine formamidase